MEGGKMGRRLRPITQPKRQEEKRSRAQKGKREKDYRSIIQRPDVLYRQPQNANESPDRE